MEKKCCKIKPNRIPLAPCTADASVAKRVHNSPVLFFCFNTAREQLAYQLDYQWLKHRYKLG